jgi:hypothetical protein
MTPTLKEVAISTELIVHGHKKGFHYKEAQLLAIEQLKEGNATLVDVFTADTNEDIYDLLEGNGVANVLKTHGFVGLITTGWAAPIRHESEPEIKASKHPDRQRVRLVIVADKENVCSVLRMEGNDEVMVDEGEATGSLNDALRKAIKRKGK